MDSSAPAPIPYGRQWIREEDLQAVLEVLRSDWLTTGPWVEKFERAVGAFTGAPHAVAVSSGTAALHAAMHAAGIGPGDEVVVPAMTFVASANSVVYQGGTPVIVDVDPQTLCLDPAAAESRITPRTKAIVAVDYAGQPCDYDRLRAIADRHRLLLIADACHSLGAAWKGRPVGTLADLTVLSFHPVKHLTTGEGGMILTAREDLAVRMRRFRNHGISRDARERAKSGTWVYDMVDLGFNYRITDFQCALGLSQLEAQPDWLLRRRDLAGRYDRAFRPLKSLSPLATRPEATHAYHLYVVRTSGRVDRKTAFEFFHRHGVNVNVHYIPVHLHSFYRERFGTARGLCPSAESAYDQILSLPMFPRMSDGDLERVVATARVLETPESGLSG
jgi:perosamine synthetase